MKVVCMLRLVGLELGTDHFAPGAHQAIQVGTTLHRLTLFIVEVLLLADQTCLVILVRDLLVHRWRQDMIIVGI